MFSIILSVVVFVIGLVLIKAGPKYEAGLNYVGVVFVTLSTLYFGSLFIITVPAGHVKVATLFGKVQDVTYAEGIHAANPLLNFTAFDLRQKTHKEERVGVPAEDKLITSMDVSIQYRTIGTMTPNILRNTGTTDSLIEVHMIPKLRSILREQGKGVLASQDFFKESVQQQLQTSLQSGLAEFLAPKGLAVETVLIRDIILPKVIQDSITETKRREQEVLKQQAELERFATEQNQKVKTAESELAAAKLQAEQIKALADAEAYKIDMITKMLAKSPSYIELRKVEQWDGVLPVYAGGDNIPMIDLRPNGEQKK